MIEIKALNKIYKTKNHKKVHALKDINLTLPDSGMVFVIGKSGSGKSTLLNLIGGLDDITSGSVIADGNDIKKLNVRKLSNYRSSYVGFIFQDYHLLEEFNVKENIELGADIANTNIDTSRILKVVGLEGYENRFIDELSGGQQQRVAIARSLAKEVKVILADEPTGNLDKETTKQILDLLKELSKDILVIVVSHNLEDANFYADRIISLDHGRLVSDREKQKNYINEFSIKNNTLFLPYHKDLTEEDIKTILEQKENITVVKQLNSGLKKTKDIIYETRNVKFESSHLSLSKFLKLFFSFFRNNKLSKILAICISAVIISLFYIFQTFSFFDDNVVLQNEIKNSDDIALVSKKCLFNHTDNSLKTSYLSPITDNDLNVITAEYSDELYKLYNRCLSITTFNAATMLQIQSSTVAASKFYYTSSPGLLNCTEEFLASKYGVDGKLEYEFKNSTQREDGIFITDYLADAIRLYRPTIYRSYEDILGYFPKDIDKTLNQAVPTNYTYFYINGIIKTDYKERYKNLLEICAKIWDDDTTNNNIADDLKEQTNYLDFIEEANAYLAITYTFTDKFDELFYNVNEVKMIYQTGLVFEYEDKSYKLKQNLESLSEDYRGFDINKGEVVFTTKLYNTLFGTSYNNNNYKEFVPHDVKVTKSFNNEFIFEKTFKIVSLTYAQTGYALYDKEDYQDILNDETLNYALYFKNKDQAANIVPILQQLHFNLQSDSVTASSYVNRTLDIFGDFIFLLSLVCLGVCIIYLISYGYKNIKHKTYEIGVLSALGGKNIDISLIFILENLVVGIGILLLSIIGMKLGAMGSNAVLIASFEKIFKINMFNIQIIDFNIKYVIMDLIIANIIIVIASIFPVFYLRKLKPVKILKAKE